MGLKQKYFNSMILNLKYMQVFFTRLTSHSQGLDVTLILLLVKSIEILSTGTLLMDKSLAPSTSARVLKTHCFSAA